MPQEAAQRATCDTCKWWDNSTPSWGHCREQSAHMPKEGGVVGQWPITPQHAWCGRHKAVAKEKVK